MSKSKIYLTAVFGLLFVFNSVAQKIEQEDYQKIFSSDYDKAIQFLQNEKWMEDSIKHQGLNPKEVFAIVFPELIRYNSIQDKIETFALESLYVLQGKSYANFSIGWFQIKPSFAENIEKDFLKFYDRKKLIEEFNIQFLDTIQGKENRAKRLNRLKDKNGILNYVCLFFKVMDKKYPYWKTEEEKIKFFACAYNYDYQKSKDEIESFIPKKFFHTGISSLSKKYSYAEIAWYYYQQK